MDENFERIDVTALKILILKDICVCPAFLLQLEFGKRFIKNKKRNLEKKIIGPTSWLTFLIGQNIRMNSNFRYPSAS